MKYNELVFLLVVHHLQGGWYLSLLFWVRYEIWMFKRMNTLPMYNWLHCVMNWSDLSICLICCCSCAGYVCRQNCKLVPNQSNVNLPAKYVGYIHILGVFDLSLTKLIRQCNHSARHTCCVSNLVSLWKTSNRWRALLFSHSTWKFFAIRQKKKIVTFSEGGETRSKRTRAWL